MTRLLTRPIPSIAIDTLIDRFAEIRRNTELAEMMESPLDTRKEVAEKIFATVPAGSRDVPRWLVVEKAMAAAALAFLGQHAAFSDVPSSAGEFLVVLNDRGVTRPIVGLDEVQGRAAASMQPMVLTEAEATRLRAVLQSGSARPRIKVADLPEYRG